ncbi:MAG: hypothetical protein LQ351_007743 [Letrouitia transgressa]|nr:MAG: hypothetical protein LQ351_007743 [Letrouitia transgressa]
MATAFAGPYIDFHCDNELLSPEILPQRTGLDDGSRESTYTRGWSTWRCDSACAGPGPPCRAPPPTSNTPSVLRSPAHSKHGPTEALFDIPQDPSCEIIDPPPSYDESIYDSPPAYGSFEPPISTLNDVKTPTFSAILYRPVLQRRDIKLPDLPQPMTSPAIDFRDTSNFREIPSKKQKKAAKEAAQANWGDEGDGNNQEGAENGGNGGEGGGAGGAGNNGDGGAGEDGGGDDWNFGTGSGKKKKGKKNKAAQEEEEKKKREEEERKRFEEETANNEDPLAWADEDNANPDDEWDAVTAAGKKNKKGKKGKPDNTTDAPNKNGFEDVSLDETPKIDLSWGNDFGMKNTNSSLGGMGGWGNNWTTGSSWGFSGTGTDTKDTSTDAGDAGMWAFEGSKKNKKKTTTSGFDFGNFGSLDETTEGQLQGEESKPEENGWGAFEPFGRKDKKKKKGNLEDIINDHEVNAIGTALIDPAVAAEESGGTWGTAGAKKDKKKGKNNTGEDNAKFENKAAIAEPEPEADLGWSAYGTKKKEKKGKKEANEEKRPAVTALPLPEPEPEPEPEPAVGAWGAFSKKEKKKTQKDEASVLAMPEKEPDNEPAWPSFNTGKKGKKGFKKETEDKHITEPTITAIPEMETEANFSWGSLPTRAEKKKDKKPTETAEKEHDILSIGADPDSTIGTGWSSFGAKKDKKPTKGKADEPTSSSLDAVKVLDSEPVIDTFSPWGSTSKKDKRTKKGITEVKEDPISVLDSAAADFTTGTLNDDLVGWPTDKKKDKKAKKGTRADEEPLPPPPPPIPAAPEAPESTSFDLWGTAKNNKKGKKGKTAEPEPAIIEVPDLIETKDPVEDDFSTLGLSPKDRRKKEKEKKEKEKKEEEKREKEAKEQEEREKKEKEEKEKKDREAKEKEKTKTGKKGKATTAEAAFKTKDLMENSIPDIAPAVEEDGWGSMWGGLKKDKKKASRKESIIDVPPPVPTPPAQGLTPPLDEGLDDLVDDDWDAFPSAKSTGKKDSKKSTKLEDLKTSKRNTKDKAVEDSLTKSNNDPPKAKEESAAKAARSFWGGMTSTSTSTAKVKSTKEKKEEEAKKPLEWEDDLDLDEIVDIEEDPEPPKKGNKAKNESKLTKITSKDIKSSKASDPKKKEAADLDALIDLDFGESKEEAKVKADEKKADAWSFWGSAKKTSGKKGDESKKEIKKPDAANQKDSAKAGSNEPEASLFADEPSSQPTKTSKATAMSASKTSGKFTVAQKVKALEEEKKRALEPLAPPPAPEPQKSEPPAKKTSAAAAGKSKLTPASKTPSGKNKAAEKEDSKESVPGSFPAEGAEEDLLDMLASSPLERKSTKKGAKTAKTKPKKDAMDIDGPTQAPPTPPPEPAAAKPAKKERARVVRDEGASSWGFWGTAPKKDVKKVAKAKDDADVPLAREKITASGLSRSKSTKTAKEKEKDEKSPKGSGSEEKEKKSESRPTKSRGSSFAGFFGGPPPTRAKTVRRTSTSAASKTASSRRQSMDIDAMGLPSPPAEEPPQISGKAAKVIGATGKSNKKTLAKGKEKAAAVPDPYPIDSDDMVMVNSIEDPIINAPVPKKPGKSKEKTSRPKPKYDAKPVDAGEDIVMVDGPSADEPELLAFDETPKKPTLQRSATSAKKPNNSKLMGFFGGFTKTRRASDGGERPSRKSIVGDDEINFTRKRTVNGRDDASKRLRRNDRKIRRSDRPETDIDGFMTDAPLDGGGVTEAEGAEARREERRTKRATKEAVAKEARDAEIKASEDRRARRREAERAQEEARKAKARERRTRREAEEEAIRAEEKRARRAAREDRLAKEAIDGVAENDPYPTEQSRGGKRRDGDLPHSSSRPHHRSDRRRSYMDKPLDSERPKSRRVRTDHSNSKHRRSVAASPTAAGVDDYFDPRNGGDGGAGEEPYMHGANDHTSSWVKSQISDPPAPPPIEGTVIEPAPDLGPGVGKGGYDRDAIDAEDGRRAARRERRKSRMEGEVERKREERRPALGAGGKRGSWLKKVAGLGM